MAKGKGGGAPYGNKNASKGGARTAAIGSLIPAGSIVSGFALGAMGKNKVAASRHSKTALGINAAAGAILGGAIGGPMGMVTAGATSGGLGYLGSKIGYSIGSKVRK